MDRLFLDFETYSKIDLSARGSVRYARHPSTQPVCMSWAINDAPVELWKPSEPMPSDVCDAVNSGIPVYAHNATFDFRIWNWIGVRDFGWPEWKLDQTVDVMALCQTYTLPGALDKAGQALQISLPKMAGKALIKRCCTPQPIKQGRKVVGFRQPVPWDPRDTPHFHNLYRYGIRDTESMREIVFKLPRQELLPIEHEIWKLTYYMNATGLPVDHIEVKAIFNTITAHIEKRSKDLNKLTDGYLYSINQYAKIKEWCAKENYPIKNCQADYLEELLEYETDIPDKVRELLELRQLLGKTSTAKFKKFNDLMVPNKETGYYFVHDNLCFHGAAPGRWAARGVQMQNFPRAKSKTPEEDIAKFVKGEYIEDPVGLGKKLVRPTIKAPPGWQLIVADYKGIENRGLAWVAEDEYTLQEFRRGFDQYIDMAAARYGRTYEAIKAGYDAEESESTAQRQMGKVIILGCGYGMGGKKFIETAKKQFGMIIPLEEGTAAVAAYRARYTLVVELWRQLKLAATRAVITGKRQSYGLIEFGTATVNGIRWLAMRLPSGKSIYYCQPRVEEHYIPDYEHMGRVPTIVHMGINSYSKKWSKLKLIPGRITENAVQGTAREIMAQGMLNVQKEMPQIKLLGTVHDEAIGMIQEKDIKNDTFTEFSQHLCDVSWSTGLPLEAVGYIEKRYKKD